MFSLRPAAARRLENIQLCLGSSYGLRAIGRVRGFFITQCIVLLFVVWLVGGIQIRRKEY